MNSIEETLEASLLSTKFEHQALVITILNDQKDSFSPQSSLFDFSQTSNPPNKVMNSLQGSNAALNDQREIWETSDSAPSTAIHDSKTPQKIKIPTPGSSKSAERKYNILIDPAFLTSSVVPPTLELSLKSHLHSGHSLTSQLSAGKIQFKPEATTLFKVSTP